MAVSKGDKEPVRDQVGFIIKRVQQALRANMDEVLSAKGLTTAQYAVLAHLRESPSLSNAELARRCFVTAPTMIRIVQGLEERGFIQKTESSAHRKVIDLTLTTTAKRILNSCDADVQTIQRQMLKGLSEKEIAHLSELLVICAEQLEGNLEKFKNGR